MFKKSPRALLNPNKLINRRKMEIQNNIFNYAILLKQVKTRVALAQKKAILFNTVQQVYLPFIHQFLNQFSKQRVLPSQPRDMGGIQEYNKSI